MSHQTLDLNLTQTYGPTLTLKELCNLMKISRSVYYSSINRKSPTYKEDWGFSFGNEIGRLVQYILGRNKGTNTLFFIHKHEDPPERWKDITYVRISCNVCP